MALHLFIVNENTLPVHLEYGFAGVTKKNDCSWQQVNVSTGNERAQAGLYADICRVHQGDDVLFYLERPDHDNTREGGRFFGIFTVTSRQPFYESQGAYLFSDLRLPLVYRILIRPGVVYRQGLTEWQLMDEMTDFRTVLEIPWTLIYRKLMGGRGCTPLLPHEEKIIKKMLDLRNLGQVLGYSSIGFDHSTLSLTHAPIRSPYAGTTNRFDPIDAWLIHLINNTTRKYEIQLQAYLMQEIKRNQALTALLFPGVEITWIGNEIKCGAGLQSIDILLFSKNRLNTFMHLVELKVREAADKEAAAQLNRYIKWLKAHIPGVSTHQIIPTIVAPGTTGDFHSVLQTFLRGYGISQYSEINYDGSLSFQQRLLPVP